MKIVHETKFTCRCPVDNSLDHYELSVEVRKLIKVEAILAAIAALPKKAFQEELTEQLAKVLGATVTTTGYHSGVKTVCVAG